MVFVPGNHEYYGMDIRAAQRGLAVDCARWGVTLLDPGAATLSGVRFIGATLWTDFLLDGQHREVAAHAAASGMLNDFRGQIGGADRPGRDFTTWEAAARHRRERAFIEAQLEAAREDGLETVVVTHRAERFIAPGSRLGECLGIPVAPHSPQRSAIAAWRRTRRHRPRCRTRPRPPRGRDRGTAPRCGRFRPCP